MARFDLTYFECDRAAVADKSRGFPRVDDRRVLNGIFRRLRTGAPWAEVSCDRRVIVADSLIGINLALPALRLQIDPTPPERDGCLTYSGHRDHLVVASAPMRPLGKEQP